MATPRAIGTANGVTTGLAQQPDVDWNIEDKARATLKFAGAYSVCLAAILGASASYKRGQVITIDGVTGMTLAKIGLKKSPGNRGLITLTYEKPLEQDSASTEGGSYSEEAPQYECEWVEISKAIEQHPRYTLAKDLTGADIEGLNPIQTVGFAFIREYFKADEARQREMYDPSAPAGSEGEILDFGSSALMMELIGKKLRGQEEFVLYSPVIREVRVVNGLPVSSNCGLRKTPPAEAGAPANYEYLQTADRTIPNGTGGRFTRTIEYTGADSVDADIYPAPPEE